MEGEEKRERRKGRKKKKKKLYLAGLYCRGVAKERAPFVVEILMVKNTVAADNVWC